MQVGVLIVYSYYCPRAKILQKQKKKSCGMVDLGYGNKLDLSRETSFCYLFNALPTEVIA